MAVGWALRRPGRISARGGPSRSQRRLNLSWSFPFEAACWFSSKGASCSSRTSCSAHGLKSSDFAPSSARSSASGSPTMRMARAPRYWTPEEHTLFVEAVQRYGWKDVKAISQHVGTRNPTQVRTHAQKLLLRQQKEQAGVMQTQQNGRELPPLPPGMVMPQNNSGDSGGNNANASANANAAEAPASAPAPASSEGGAGDASAPQANGDDGGAAAPSSEAEEPKVEVS